MDRIYKPDRAVGNTTRQADLIIQLLFERRGQWIPVIDHASLSNPRMARDINNNLVDLITRRINAEHSFKGINKTLKHIETTAIDTYIVNDDYFKQFKEVFGNKYKTNNSPINLLCLPK